LPNYANLKNIEIINFTNVSTIYLRKQLLKQAAKKANDNQWLTKRDKLGKIIFVYS